MILIEFKNVSIKYGRTEILNNVSFDISSGDVIFIKGGNGSGKTTLLKTIMQIGYSDHLNATGNMRYWLPSNTKDFSQTLKREICFAEQNENLGDTTVKEYLSFPFWEGVRKCPYGSSDKEIESYIIEYLQANGINNSFPSQDLKKLLRMKVKKLSGGQKHLLSIFGELIGMEEQARLFIFDEPLNHLDNANAIMVLNKITSLHNTHPEAAILVCSHCMSITCINKCYQIKKGLLTKADNSFYQCHGCFGDVDSDGMYIAD